MSVLILIKWRVEPGLSPQSAGRGIETSPGGGGGVVVVVVCCGTGAGSAVGTPTATSAGILTLGTGDTTTSSSSSSHSHKPSEIRQVTETSNTQMPDTLSAAPEE